MTEKNECRVELLLGRKIRALDGRVIGRIEEMHAELEHDYYVVTEFLVGPIALVERFAVRHFGFTLAGRVHGYRVRWDQLNLEDPAHPRLTCAVEDLQRVGARRRRNSTRAA